jgi:hypothetical protein
MCAAEVGMRKISFAQIGILKIETGQLSKASAVKV